MVDGYQMMSFDINNLFPSNEAVSIILGKVCDENKIERKTSR